MSSPSAGQIKVFAGVTVAATMVQGLWSPDRVSDVRSDLRKPENSSTQRPNLEAKVRLLDCAVATAQGGAPDLAWVFELEGMDLLGYDLAMSDLLPTILTHTDAQRVGLELFGLQEAAKRSSGFQREVFAAAWELTTKAYTSLEQRQKRQQP